MQLFWDEDGQAFHTSELPQLSMDPEQSPLPVSLKILDD